MWLGREPPVYSTESPASLSSRRLCVAEPHCPSAAIPRLHRSRTGLATDPTCFSFDCWLFPDWQLRLKGSEAGAEGASFWVNIPSTQTPLNQQGVSLLIIHAAVLSPHTRERERERCHKEQAKKKFKDTLQLCVSAPVPPNWFLCKLPAWSCIVMAFVSGLEKAFAHPRSPAKATPFSTPATPWEDCLYTGSSVPKGIDALRQGRWGRWWEMDLRGYHWEVGADLDCLLVKEHVHQTWSDLTPGLPSLRPYWSAVMTSWQASSTQLPAVEVGCSPMNLGSGVVNMPQEYTMTWDGRWGWGWGAGGGLFRLKKTNSRQELD